MYALNVTHLKQFYASDLGEMVGRQLRAKITSIWTDSPTDLTLIIGYPTPLWRASQPPKNLLVGMPAEHGAMCWPALQNKVFATHDGELPLADSCINRVVLLHALEHSANVSNVMQEIWRVLTPQGRVLVVVPNRMGLWARSPNSPFGYGRPFSMSQLKSAVEESQLTFLKSYSAIFTPPSHKRMWLKASATLEVIGQMFLPMCGGLHIVEAEKQLYAPILQPLKAGRRTRMKPVIIPASANFE